MPILESSIAILGRRAGKERCSMVDRRFANIDWNRLTTRLVGVAVRLFIQEQCFDDDAILSGTGQSAKDLAYGAILEVLKDDTIQWKPKGQNDDPFPLFVTVMRHNFLDLVKDGREHKRTTILDPNDKNGERKQRDLGNLPDDKDQFSSAEAAALAYKIYPCLNGDAELKDYVDAVLIFDLHKREDIAVLLGTTPEDISKRRRRLQVALASWRRLVTRQ